MEVLQLGWDFFQNQILGMQWINQLVGDFLNICGLDTSTRIGGSVQFFLYDTIMSIFGWKVAVVYVLLGLVIAVAGGTLIEKLHLENQVEEFIRNGHSIDVPEEELHFKDRMKYAWEQVVSTAKKVFPYVLVGVGIGAVIHNWVPEELIVNVLGTGNPFGVIIATVAGIPMYADIFGTIPIAEALLAKGAQLGVVLSFMMGVTALSLPSMIMLKKAVKPKMLGLFAAICTIGIIIVGYFFNAFQSILI